MDQPDKFSQPWEGVHFLEDEPDEDSIDAEPAEDSDSDGDE